MNFAILGTDPDILLLAAAARNAGHKIVWLGDVRREDEAAIGRPAGNLADRASEWELLLDRKLADGVFVGRGTANDDLRAEQLKRLVAEAMPLLIVHPILESVLPYYEIDMARRETSAVVQHFNPLVDLPVATDLAIWVRCGHPEIGAIHQLTCERKVTSAARGDVLACIARDVELLAAVGGDIRRVSAIGPATPDASFASLQVQMTTTIVASLRWSVGGVANIEAFQLALLGEHGTITLRESGPASQADAAWQLEIAHGDQQDVQSLPAFDPAKAAIARFAEAIAEPSIEHRAAASTWAAATRAMEVVDAVELALQKGRTIEVFQQQLTERLAFRGTMAAMGCGLLLLAFFAVVAVAMLGGAEGIVQQRLLPSWPLILLAVLAFFLFLQAIPMLAQKRITGRENPPATPPSKS